jgi:hypothetical protein
MTTPLPPLDLAHLGAYADVGEALLDATFEVLNAQEIPAPERGLVVVLDLPEDCCDAVVVALRSVMPMSGDPVGCEPIRWTGDWAIRVSRGCDATLGSWYNQLPSDEQEKAVNALMLADVAVLTTQLAPMIQHRVCRAVYPTLSRHVTYQRGRFTPHREGGCVGWTYDFRLSVPA